MTMTYPTIDRDPSGGRVEMPLDLKAIELSRVAASKSTLFSVEQILGGARLHLEALSSITAIKLEVEKQLSRARNAIALRKSEIVLDVVPEILRQKGLATSKSPLGSEDARSAVIDGDPEYRRLVEVKEELEAISSFFDKEYQNVSASHRAAMRAADSARFSNKTSFGE